MNHYRYKVEIFRTKSNVISASRELEEFINGNAKHGWRVLSCIYHSSILCYEILFEKYEEDHDG